jgi:hypothetical protein
MSSTLYSTLQFTAAPNSALPHPAHTLHPAQAYQQLLTDIQEPAHVILANIQARLQPSTLLNIINYTALFERLCPSYHEDDYLARLRILETYASALSPALWTRTLNQLQLTRLRTLERMHLEIGVILSAVIRVFIQQTKECIPDSEFLQALYVHEYLYPNQCRPTYSEPRYLDPVLVYFVRQARSSQTAPDHMQQPPVNIPAQVAPPASPALCTPFYQDISTQETLSAFQVPANCASNTSGITPSLSPPCAVVISSQKYENNENISTVPPPALPITSPAQEFASKPSPNPFRFESSRINCHRYRRYFRFKRASQHAHHRSRLVRKSRPRAQAKLSGSSPSPFDSDHTFDASNPPPLLDVKLPSPSPFSNTTHAAEPYYTPSLSTISLPPLQSDITHQDDTKHVPDIAPQSGTQLGTSSSRFYTTDNATLPTTRGHTFYIKNSTSLFVQKPPDSAHTYCTSISPPDCHYSHHFHSSLALKIQTSHARYSVQFSGLNIAPPSTDILYQSKDPPIVSYHCFPPLHSQTPCHRARIRFNRPICHPQVAISSC